jgi:hypothetical protein
MSTINQAGVSMKDLLWGLLGIIGVIGLIGQMYYLLHYVIGVLTKLTGAGAQKQ